ncbi:hypothetical protein PFISCL1PPCAC_20451 [Pristionchus fissidentatus]|uniref:Uncharacterized protein n=1 Tax=Pristionchus fissidentatus TaxID=1538716 RepID=A0AAV5WH57_9BILA|nr:hypothetical protein PFISCL1PPCAC_20451 [Pristionchus fissidentatus]
MALHLRTILAFTVVAMTSLLPYNLFMNAHEYFYYKLRNVSDSNGSNNEDLLTRVSGMNQSLFGSEEPTTELQRTYEGWFTVTSGIACILGSLLNTVATNKLSNGFRVLTGHAIVLLSLLPTLFFTFVDTDADQVHFFWLSMFFSSISSFGSMGLIGAGITGLAATFPESYMQIVMIGQAVAGIITALLSIVCQAATANATLNGRIYFGLAFLWTLFSVFCYFCLVRSNYAKDIIGRADGERLLDHEDEDDYDNGEMEGDAGAVDSLQAVDEGGYFEGWSEIIEQARPDMLCAAFILIVTLGAFPAVASQVRTETTNETWRAYFSSICCFLLFNICDAMGRVFASRVNISRSLLQKLSIARILLIPLILVCDVEPRFHSPTLIRSDAIFILLNMTLALSHGFCFTHAYVKGVQVVEPALRETAGSMLSLVCVVAALMGSMLGVALVSIV